MNSAEQPPQQESRHHSYIFDSESAAEMGRLLLQDRAVNEGMGGLLTERSDQAEIRHVLDIGCGPGGWVMSLAQTYPHMHVVGIDSSQLMIHFARTQAQREGLINVRFEVMDALEPLRFPDHYFDLVNIRFAVSYIPRQYWPMVLRECFRVTCPGGSLRLTENDRLGITNSAAYEQINIWLAAMTHQSGYGFSEDGATYSMTPMLTPLLSGAGYTAIQSRPYAIDFSHGSPLQGAHWQILRTVIATTIPILERLHIATPEEVKRAQANIEEAIQKENFYGLIYILTVWGYRPALSD